ncbi:MAG: hypothetical protein V2J07_07945, partial [Anaerolineae bacterium]|nr:hypothetical protein [Anaerolineae bacterium]
MMNNKPIKVIALTLAALVLIACVCPLTNLISSVTSTRPEDIVELIPEDLTEQMPDMSELLEDLPLESEGLTELLNQGVPENIPVMPDYNELTAVAGTVYYETPRLFEEVLTFYEVEMEQLGWQFNADASNIIKSQEFALMNYTSDTQIAIIGITGADTETQVTIVVTN